MFKKYRVRVRPQDAETGSRKGYDVEFYVRSKPTRGGFCHQAVVVGCLPVKDGYEVWSDRSERMAKKSYVNRTWESWDGQSVLRMLWDKVLKLEWVDAARLPKRNPFGSDREPKCESLWDPDELFAGC